MLRSVSILLLSALALQAQAKIDAHQAARLDQALLELREQGHIELMLATP